MASAAQDPDAVDDLAEAAEQAADAAEEERGDRPVESADRRVDELAAQGRVVLDELGRAEAGGLSREELSDSTGLEPPALSTVLEHLRDRGEVVEPEVDWFAVPTAGRRDTAEEDVPEPEADEEHEDDEDEEPAGEPPASPSAMGSGLPVRTLIAVEAVFSAPAGATDEELARQAHILGDAMAEEAGAGSATYKVLSVEAFDTPRKVKL